jgi:tRNA-modifying protein YgfZ
MKPNPEFLTQYAALTEGVGIAVLPRRTIISVTGSDRAQILQSFTTNDVKKLVPGTGCEAFVTNSQGKALGHVLIFCESSQHVLNTTPGQADTLLNHFNRYVITEDVEFKDQSAEFCDLLIAGPNAAELLANTTGVQPPTELLHHVPASIAGRPVIIRRVEYALSASWFLQTAVSDAAAVLSALAEGGAVRCDAPAVESARLEAGVPLFGFDITDDNLPQEVARDAQAISFMKGCYLGQETVARIDALGHVNRLLAGLKIQGDEIPAAGAALLADGKPTGSITSAAWSPKLAAPLALGYIRRPYAKAGSMLSIGGKPAEVVRLPLS